MGCNARWSCLNLGTSVCDVSNVFGKCKFYKSVNSSNDLVKKSRSSRYFAYVFLSFMVLMGSFFFSVATEEIVHLFQHKDLATGIYLGFDFTQYGLILGRLTTRGLVITESLRFWSEFYAHILGLVVFFSMFVLGEVCIVKYYNPGGLK